MAQPDLELLIADAVSASRTTPLELLKYAALFMVEGYRNNKGYTKEVKPSHTG